QGILWASTKKLLSTVKNAMQIRLMAITRNDMPKLSAYTEQLSEKMGIATPLVMLDFASEKENAFASGITPNHGFIIITASLLELLEDDEIEAIIAHEFGHVYKAHALKKMALATI